MSQRNSIIANMLVEFPTFIVYILKEQSTHKNLPIHVANNTYRLVLPPAAKESIYGQALTLKFFKRKFGDYNAKEEEFFPDGTCVDPQKGTISSFKYCYSNFVVDNESIMFDLFRKDILGNVIPCVQKQ